ncbi:MAG: AMP-binding protein, partial [Streptosporangiaceae bacterium]
LLTGQDAPGRLLDALTAALDGTGPAILPLDPALPPSRLDELIGAFAPTAIITPDGVQRLAPAGQAGDGWGDDSRSGDGEGGVGEGGLGRGGDGEGGLGRGGVAPDIAVVLATSGSTGVPKGAELTASALLASARAALDRIGADPARRWLCSLPAHHISGLGILVRSLVAGSAPTFAERLEPEVVEAAVRGPDRVGYVSMVPTQLRRLLEAGAPVAEFDTILLGGAAIPADLLAAAAAAGARVVTTYGMTETSGGCVYDGVPLDGVRVATGADGRIRISGPVLFARYRLAPELTAAALDDGWFVTADLGGLGPDGRLVVRGRADDVINTGGEKVVAGEVERVLRESGQVRDAVVVGVPDPEWGERVTALVVPADAGRPPSLDQLREHVGRSLPRYAAPRGLVLMPEIPLLSSGKPDRQLLRKLAESPG